MSGSSALMSALMDPGVQALSGFAQGMAQAAMPSRLPVPFGAALGMAGAGALQGGENSLAMQQQAQLLQGEQMQNQVAKAQLPSKLAQANAMANVWKRFGAGGSGVPSISAGDGNASSGGVSSMAASPPAFGAPDYSKATLAAYQSLPAPTQKLVANAVMTSGLPPEAIAPWISTIQNESGGNLNAPDSKTGAIGPGQVEPPTGQMLGYNPQQLRDPQTNLIASAKYFKQQWASGGGPTQAFAGYNTGNPQAPDPDYVQKGVSRLAQWGYPGVQAPASFSGDGVSSGAPTAADAFTQYQQLMSQANDLERQRSNAQIQQQMGLPVAMPAGDPAALRASAQQYLQLALAGPTAMEQANAAIYEAKNKPIATRAGIEIPTGNGGYTELRQPEPVTLEDNNGTSYSGYMQLQPDGKSVSYIGFPPSVDPTKMHEIGEGQEEVIKQLAEEYGGEDRQKYEGAQNANFQLDELDHDIGEMNSHGGWTTTGPGNDFRMNLVNDLNGVAQTLGLHSIDPNGKETGFWQQASKIQTQLAFAQAKQLGSREAQAIIQMSLKATPGPKNTPLAYQAISSGLREMNNREIDLYNFKTNWIQQHGGNLVGAEPAFNNQFTPQMYAARAISTLKPFKITATDQSAAMKQMQQYLPGTLIQLPNGKTSMVPQWTGAAPIPSNILSLQQGSPANGG